MDQGTSQCKVGIMMGGIMGCGIGGSAGLVIGGASSYVSGFRGFSLIKQSGKYERCN